MTKCNNCYIEVERRNWKKIIGLSTMSIISILNLFFIVNNNLYSTTNDLSISDFLGDNIYVFMILSYLFVFSYALWNLIDVLMEEPTIEKIPVRSLR